MKLIDHLLLLPLFLKRRQIWCIIMKLLCQTHSCNIHTFHRSVLHVFNLYFNFRFLSGINQIRLIYLNIQFPFHQRNVIGRCFHLPSPHVVHIYIVIIRTMVLLSKVQMSSICFFHQMISSVNAIREW